MADQSPLRTDPTAGRDMLARRGVEIAAIAFGLAAALFLLWRTAEAILLIFAGLLFGVFLDACARGLERVLPLGRGWRLALVCIVLLLAVGGALYWGGKALATQADDLIGTITEQLRALRGEIEEAGLQPQREGKEPGSGRHRGDTDVQTLARMFLPDPRGLFSQARTAASAAFGMLGSVIVVFFIGLFVAANPEAYRRGVLSLLPIDKRRRVGEVLDETAETLRWFLIGQVVSMVVTGVSTGVGLWLVGLPGAVLLGLQAGIFNFVPYLGPMIGGVPVLLTALASGPSMVAWALGVYVLVQLVESYVLAPLVQRRMVDLQPAVTLAGQILFGTVLGGWGVALAMPLMAAARVAVLRLYVEDRLGDSAGGDPKRG